MNIAGVQTKLLCLHPLFLHLHHRRQLFQQVGQGPPKVGVVLLQGGDVLGVHAAVGVGLDRHLV